MLVHGFSLVPNVPIVCSLMPESKANAGTITEANPSKMPSTNFAMEPKSVGPLMFASRRPRNPDIVAADRRRSFSKQDRHVTRPA